MRHRPDSRRAFRGRGLRRSSRKLERAVIEALEWRQYLTIVPHISGARSANQGASYELDLAYTGATPSSWTIHWGDGASTSNVAGSATSVQHTYDSGRQSYTILAEAFEGSMVYTSNQLALNESFGVGGVVTKNVNDGTDTAYATAIQPDGKILVGGLTTVDENSDFALLRYNANGSLDTSFGDDGLAVVDIHDTDGIRSIVLQGNKILVTGRSTIGDFVLVRFDSDGALDDTFGETNDDGIVLTDFDDGTDYSYGLALDEDGKILVSGYSNGQFTLARYSSNGVLDPTFSGDGKVTAATSAPSSMQRSSVAEMSDGHIVVAGGAGQDFAVARFTDTGALDTSNFGSSGIKLIDFNSTNETFYGMALQDDDYIVVAGSSGSARRPRISTMISSRSNRKTFTVRLPIQLLTARPSPNTISSAASPRRAAPTATSPAASSTATAMSFRPSDMTSPQGIQVGQKDT